MNNPEEDINPPTVELYMCIITFRMFGCPIDKLGESSEVKIDSIEEVYMQLVELRGVDALHPPRSQGFQFRRNS
jgi:hypothetical protein